MVNILIIGNGGREHAIAMALLRYPSSIVKIMDIHLYYYGTHPNPGLDFLTQTFILRNIDCVDYSDLMESISLYRIDMAIIGPEAYLADGVVDLLHTVGVKCIGPTKLLSQLETSKIFTRIHIKNHSQLRKYNPDFTVFNPANDNTRWVGEREKYILSLLDSYEKAYGGYVVKADGLCGGKGVLVSGDHLSNTGQALSHCSNLIKQGKNFIIEQKLLGKEFSLMSFSDGNCIKSMPVIQDFKRVYEGDKGPNTGGMGSISYKNFMMDFLNTSDISEAHKINETIIKSIQETTKQKYIGIIYGSFIKIDDQNGQYDTNIKIIEYNCRFGDPECINALSLLKTNLYDIFSHMSQGTLNTCPIFYSREFTVCRYLVPDGYPNNPVKDKEVTITCKRNLHKNFILNNNIIFASISPSSFAIYSDKSVFKMYLNGSRTIAIIGKGDSFSSAINQIEKTSALISGPLFSRTDIGTGMDNIQKNKNDKSNNVTKSNDVFSYANSGVDIDKGNEVVQNIQSYVQSTYNDASRFDNYGDFGGMFRFRPSSDSVLVSSTDGVGTKSILAEYILGDEGLYNLGKDLVNHCVNDILVKGARPLFFLDYFASSKLKPKQVELFVKGASEACKDVDCVLIGGETAEMPGVYREGRVDLVGTIVGEVKEQSIIDGKKNIKKGDILIGLRSSGPHTNGYSFIRSLLNAGKIDEDFCRNMGLLNPHRCYYKDIQKIIQLPVQPSLEPEQNIIHALCHITGGGLIDNPKRVLPPNMEIQWNWKDYNMGSCFTKLQEVSGIDDMEMRRIFNCGIGIIIFISPEHKESILSFFSDTPDYAFEIGSVS